MHTVGAQLHEHKKSTKHAYGLITTKEEEPSGKKTKSNREDIVLLNELGARVPKEHKSFIMTYGVPKMKMSQLIPNIKEENESLAQLEKIQEFDNKHSTKTKIEKEDLAYMIEATKERIKWLKKKAIMDNQ